MLCGGIEKRELILNCEFMLPAYNRKGVISWWLENVLIQRPEGRS